MVFLGQTLSRVSGNDDLEQLENQMYDLHAFLGIAGRRMGLYFTLEMATLPPVNVPAAETLINGKTRFASTDDLIAALSKKFQWFSFEVDGRHARIIHVIDKRLRGKDGYALERKADIEFAGTLDELCWTLHKQIDNLYGHRGGLVHEVGTDYYTETIAQGRNETARQILTDAVPLGCYEPVLWRARMQGDGHDPAAEIDVTYGEPRESVDCDDSRWWWWLDTAHERGAKGKQLRCFFTIETIYRDPDDPASCPIYFNDEETFDSAESLVAELTKRVGQLTAVKDANRPEIIHLIDKELLKVGRYALERRIDIDYDGTPDGLLLAIEQTADVGPRRSARTLAAFSGDPETRIAAHAKGKPLREILTDCIPLERTYDILWHARTWLRKDGPQTTIDYRFPR